MAMPPCRQCRDGGGRGVRRGRELGNLSNLRSLSLHWNKLSGEIPPELGNLSNLESMRLYGNNLSGEIPPELAGMSDLRGLSLYDNGLSGKIPDTFLTMNKLQGLYFDQNDGLCAPNTSAFAAWLDGIFWYGPTCP